MSVRSESLRTSHIALALIRRTQQETHETSEIGRLVLRHNIEVALGSVRVKEGRLDIQIIKETPSEGGCTEDDGNFHRRSLRKITSYVVLECVFASMRSHTNPEAQRVVVICLDIIDGMGR